MKKFKRVMTLLLCIAMTTGLFACGSQPTAPSAGDGSAPADGAAPSTYKSEIIIGNPQDITTTDPQGSNTDPNMILFYMTHETLVDLDGSEVIPSLATYEVIDDCHYRFTIPANVTFTDGSPCTASDIKFTLERAANSSFTSTKVALVQDIEVVNDQEVIIELSAPSQDFLTTLAHKSLSILSEKAITEKGDEAASMGTGMYSLDEWIPGDYISVVRYDGYHGEKAKTERVTFRFMSENSARVIALQTGEIDVCLDIPNVEISRISDDSSLNLVQIPDVRMMYLGFNMQKAPFDDIKLRQALAHAVDKESLILGAYDGFGSVHNSCVNQDQFALDESLTGYDFDLEKARQLLDEAGYGDGLDIEISTYKGGNRSLILQIIQADWAKIGVNVKINELETAALKSLMKEGGHEVVLYAWTDADGTDFTVRGMLYSTSGSNRCLLKDPKLDAMIDEALIESDVETRTQMYYDIQAYVQELSPIIPLCTGVINVGTKAGLDGVIWKSTNKHDFRNICLPET